MRTGRTRHRAAAGRDDERAAPRGLRRPVVADAFRLGFHALTGDWRDAPGVEVAPCKVARVWSAHGIPAMLDGESVRLRSLAEVRYNPKVARILAIPKDA